MKAAIHPAYNEIRVMCACGSSFTTRSTHKGDIHVEICSCLPSFLHRQAEADGYRRPGGALPPEVCQGGASQEVTANFARISSLRFGGGFVFDSKRKPEGVRSEGAPSEFRVFCEIRVGNLDLPNHYLIGTVVRHNPHHFPAGRHFHEFCRAFLLLICVVEHDAVHTP